MFNDPGGVSKPQTEEHDPNVSDIDEREGQMPPEEAVDETDDDLDPDYEGDYDDTEDWEDEEDDDDDNLFEE